MRCVGRVRRFCGTVTLLKSSLEKSVVNVPTALQRRNKGLEEGEAAYVRVRVDLEGSAMTPLPLSHLPLSLSLSFSPTHEHTHKTQP